MCRGPGQSVWHFDLIHLILVQAQSDDKADEYATFAKGWGLTGHYHEFAYGPKVDQEGNFWVGTTDMGLINLDRHTLTYQNYMNEPQDPQKLTTEFEQGLNKEMDIIRSTIRDTTELEKAFEPLNTLANENADLQEAIKDARSAAVYFIEDHHKAAA